MLLQVKTSIVCLGLRYSISRLHLVSICGSRCASLPYSLAFSISLTMSSIQPSMPDVSIPIHYWQTPFPNVLAGFVLRYNFPISHTMHPPPLSHHSFNPNSLSPTHPPKTSTSTSTMPPKPKPTISKQTPNSNHTKPHSNQSVTHPITPSQTLSLHHTTSLTPTTHEKMCWLTAWTFSCTHIWTVQSGSCAHPFTPSCKLSETRTEVPELCRECRFKALLAQAPTSHDDVLEDEEDKRLKLEAIGEVDDGNCEREGLLGNGRGKGGKNKRGMEMRGRRKGWLRRFW